MCSWARWTAPAVERRFDGYAARMFRLLRRRYDIFRDPDAPWEREVHVLDEDDWGETLETVELVWAAVEVGALPSDLIVAT